MFSIRQYDHPKTSTIPRRTNDDTRMITQLHLVEEKTARSWSSRLSLLCSDATFRRDYILSVSCVGDQVERDALLFLVKPIAPGILFTVSSFFSAFIFSRERFPTPLPFFVCIYGFSVVFFRGKFCLLFLRFREEGNSVLHLSSEIAPREREG